MRKEMMVVISDFDDEDSDNNGDGHDDSPFLL